MPLSLNPNATVAVWLDSDAAAPEATRPAFLFRFVSSLEKREAIKIREDAYAPGGYVDEPFLRELERCIEVGLCGWRNIERPYGKGQLLSFLTDEEIKELSDKWIAAVSITEREKKALSSLAPSSGDGTPAPTNLTAPAQSPPITPSSGMTANAEPAAA